MHVCTQRRHQISTRGGMYIAGVVSCLVWASESKAPFPTPRKTQSWTESYCLSFLSAETTGKHDQTKFQHLNSLLTHFSLSSLQSGKQCASQQACFSASLLFTISSAFQGLPCFPSWLLSRLAMLLVWDGGRQATLGFTTSPCAWQLFLHLSKVQRQSLSTVTGVLKRSRY